VFKVADESLSQLRIDNFSKIHVARGYRLALSQSRQTTMII